MSKIIRKNIGMIGVATFFCAYAATAQNNSVVYTEEQAATGQDIYEARCASCHGYNLEGFELAPSLSGNFFTRRWGADTADRLAINVRRMPPNAVSMSELEATNVLAYLLSRNGVEAGDVALSGEIQTLANYTIPAQEIVNRRFSPRAPSFSTNGPVVPVSRLNTLTPVSNDMLLNPPADDWLVWRRTHANLGHSPLDEITPNNVADLRLAWTWSLPSGANMMTPIVHDGVMFTLSSGDVVQAIDAATGDLLWAYQHELEGDYESESKKGVAIYEDKIIVGTSDIKLIALQAKTGKLAWEHVIETNGELDHRFKSAPMVVKSGAA